MERLVFTALLTLLSSLAVSVAEPPVYRSSTSSNSYRSSSSSAPSSSYGAPSSSSPSNSYGPPSSSSNTYNAPSSSLNTVGNTNNNNFNRNQDFSGFQSFTNNADKVTGPKVFRHISLFVAPDSNEDRQQVRTIRPQQNKDKHVQIIFIKAPSHSSAQQTEIQLSPQPEQKTLVYVLLKKPEAGESNVKVLGPPPTKKPPQPEVYFIKYSDSATGSQSGGYNTGASFGASGGAPSTSYGAP